MSAYKHIHPPRKPKPVIQEILVVEESPQKSVQLTPRQVEPIRTIERPGDEWSIRPGNMVYTSVGERGEVRSKYTSYWYKIVHKLTDGPKTIELAAYTENIGYYKCFNWFLKKRGVFRTFAIPSDLPTDDKRPKSTRQIEIPSFPPSKFPKSTIHLPKSQRLIPYKTFSFEKKKFQ